MKPLGRRAVALLGLAALTTTMILMSRGGAALSRPSDPYKDTIKSEVELTTKDIGGKENVLGNLVTDAMRETTKSDIAFLAASYFNSDYKVAKGDIQTSDVLKSLEFAGDNLAIVNLTGAQVIKALEHGLFLYPKPSSGFLHFSGLEVTISGDGDRGKRVLSVKVGENALEPGKSYKVVMPAPLANGALAYFKVWKKEDIDKKSEKDLDGKTLETAVKDFLKSKKKLEKGDERLTVKGK